MRCSRADGASHQAVPARAAREPLEEGGATEEAAGTGRGRGGMAGGTGSGTDERALNRKHMIFEDEDAWIDDEDAGPGVIG